MDNNYKYTLNEDNILFLMELIKNNKSINTASLGNIPKGIIMAWPYPVEDIPDGWHLCDGTDGTEDLRGRFLFGADENHPLGKIDGEEEHTLTVEEMPEHNHSVPYPNLFLSNGLTSSTLTNFRVQQNSIREASGATGGGIAHNNMPPYYAINWIQKMVDDSDLVTTSNVYSTEEETVIGTWIDKKPIYRFVHTCNPIMSGGNERFSKIEEIDFSDMDNIITCTASIKYKAGNNIICVPLQGYNTSSGASNPWRYRLDLTSGGLYFSIPNISSTIRGTMIDIIEYTKISDEIE